jgi:hypothetical protein
VRQHALILVILILSAALLLALRARGGRDARDPSKDVGLYCERIFETDPLPGDEFAIFARVTGCKFKSDNILRSSAFARDEKEVARGNTVNAIR